MDGDDGDGPRPEPDDDDDEEEEEGWKAEADADSDDRLTTGGFAFVFCPAGREPEAARAFGLRVACPGVCASGPWAWGCKEG